MGGYIRPYYFIKEENIMPTIKIKNATLTFPVDTQKYPPITRFRDEYFFLSNFYPCDMTIGGIKYKNAEAAFQSMKCESLKDREQFSDLDPKDAKRLGRKIKLNENWENEKVDYMKIVVRKKFSESGNSDLRDKLVETFPRDLIEENDWNDSFWGVSNKKGKNVLGKILEEERWCILQARLLLGDENAIDILGRVGNTMASVIVDLLFSRFNGKTEINVSELEPIDTDKLGSLYVNDFDVKPEEIDLPKETVNDFYKVNDVDLVQTISKWLSSKKDPSSSKKPTKATIKLDGITITFF